MDIDKNFHDRVAHLCLKCFKTLPKSGKPKPNEWTVLSCIIMEFDGNLEVVALGTGSKCIGGNKMSAAGDILNDSHAEVICRRSFLRFLYNNMKENNHDSFIYFNSKKFCLKRDVRFHFFTTHVPCGDAAVFSKQNCEDFGHVIAKQPKSSEVTSDDYEVPMKKPKTEENEDIFRTGAKCLPEDEKQDLKLAGSGYHILGAVRTKPGRGDPTLSVSCSDKLSKWCHLGIQGALLTLLLEKPIYFHSFTIAENTPFNKEALERALYDRLGDVELNHPYIQQIMVVGQSYCQFEFSKDPGKHPCASSISWCKINDKCLEVAVEGRRQGVTKKNINTDAARLSICKVQLFKCFVKVYELCNINLVQNCDIKTLCYKDVKMLAVDYQSCWSVLRKSFKIWTNKDERHLHFFSK